MRYIVFFILILALFASVACTATPDAVLDSLGEYSTKGFYTSGEFQDYTDYAKYTYEDIDISDNTYFEIITTESKAELDTHIEDFEKWIKAISESDPKNEVVENYDFDNSIISFDDYLYIYDDPDYIEAGFPLGYYNVYFLDTETLTLYFFHNNI